MSYENTSDSNLTEIHIDSSDKKNCLKCNKTFIQNTLDKYNGVCGRCFKKSDEKKENKHIRKTIPPQLRLQVWENKIGDKLKGNCFACDKLISIFSFECAHIISDKDNGEMSIENMEVSCTTCNRSCGEMNFHEYKKMFPKDYYKKYTQTNSINLDYINKKINIIFGLLVISIIVSATSNLF
jgi:hypothetical protein